MKNKNSNRKLTITHVALHSQYGICVDTLLKHKILASSRKMPKPVMGTKMSQWQSTTKVLTCHNGTKKVNKGCALCHHGYVLMQIKDP